MRRHGPQNAAHHRTGLTRIELIVGSALALLFLTIAALAVGYSRERARNAQCQFHLRSFGVALYNHADADAAERLCSGAYDYRRDGDPSVYGWVADVVNGQHGLPQEMMCPSNSTRGSATLNDLLSGDFEIGSRSDNQSGELLVSFPDRWQTGLCAEMQVGTATNRTGGSIPTKDPARAGVVSELLDQGYGTNYATSWFLVRREFREFEDPSTNVRRSHSRHDPTYLEATRGPLRLRDIHTSNYPSNTIPLMADAAIVPDALTRSIPGSILAQGAPLAATMTVGLATWDSTEQRIVPMPPGTTTFRYAHPDGSTLRDDVLPTPDNRPTSATWSDFGGTDGILWLQDTRAWAPHHRTGLRLSANILMADGSIRSVTDVNGDGFLNPGFPIGDSTVELPPTEVFCGGRVMSPPSPGFF